MASLRLGVRISGLTYTPNGGGSYYPAILTLRHRILAIMTHKDSVPPKSDTESTHLIHKIHTAKTSIVTTKIEGQMLIRTDLNDDGILSGTLGTKPRLYHGPTKWTMSVD